MKIYHLALAALVLCVGAYPAAANGVFFNEQTPTQYLAKDRLLGANVHNADGKIIGHIEDLIVENDNKIVGVIVGVGGLMGIGDKKVGVDLSALSIEATDGKINVVIPAATKDALTAAVEFKRIAPPKGWLQRASEKGEELRDKSKDAYEAAKKNAAPALEKAKAAAKDAYETAKEKAAPASKNANEAAQPAHPDATPSE